MHYRLTRIQRIVRLLVALQLGAGAAMLRFTQPNVTVALASLALVLLITAGLGVRLWVALTVRACSWRPFSSLGYCQRLLD